jgi:hypothetical protein
MVEETLEAIPILTSKFGSIGYPLPRRRGVAYIDNRWEVIIRYGPLALSGQPMITQHWGPVLIAPGRPLRIHP